MTQELRKLAEAATQGKWSVKLQESPYPNWYLIYSEQVDPPLIVQVLRGSSVVGLASHPDYFTEKTPRDTAAHANAAYIAAANPAAILSLLDRLEKAEKDAERCKRFIDAMCEETFDTWTNGYRMQQVAMNIQHAMNITDAMEASK